MRSSAAARLLVVGEALDQQRDAVRAVALVHDGLVVDRLARDARAALDGAVDVVVGDRGLLGLLHRVDRRRVAGRCRRRRSCAATSMFLMSLANDFARRRVDDRLLVLRRRPLGMPAHDAPLEEIRGSVYGRAYAGLPCLEVRRGRLMTLPVAGLPGHGPGRSEIVARWSRGGVVEGAKSQRAPVRQPQQYAESLRRHRAKRTTRPQPHQQHDRDRQQGDIPSRRGSARVSTAACPGAICPQATRRLRSPCRTVRGCRRRSGARRPAVSPISPIVCSNPVRRTRSSWAHTPPSTGDRVVDRGSQQDREHDHRRRRPTSAMI